MRRHRAMGEDRSFGMTGGTARVQLKEVIFRGGVVIGGRVWLICKQALVRFPTRRLCSMHRDELMNGFELTADGFHIWQITARSKENFHLRIIENIAPL